MRADGLERTTDVRSSAAVVVVDGKEDPCLFGSVHTLPLQSQPTARPLATMSRMVPPWSPSADPSTPQLHKVGTPTREGELKKWNQTSLLTS